MTNNIINITFHIEIILCLTRFITDFSHQGFIEITEDWHYMYVWVTLKKVRGTFCLSRFCLGRFCRSSAGLVRVTWRIRGWLSWPAEKAWKEGPSINQHSNKEDEKLVPSKTFVKEASFIKNNSYLCSGKHHSQARSCVHLCERTLSTDLVTENIDLLGNNLQ